MKFVLAVLLFALGYVAARLPLAQITFAEILTKIQGNPETSAIAITGTLAFIGAIWGVFSQRAITRRQVTLEFLSNSENDKDLSGAFSYFIEIAKRPEGLAQYGSQDKEHWNETKSMRLVMNHFELIAIGIERGIIDYEIYKLWNKSAVLQYWAYSVPFVIVLRRRLNNPALYREFETMAGWFSGAQKPRRGYRLGQWI